MASQKTDTVSLTYDADIKALRDKIASIPDITAAEARKIVRELDRANKQIIKNQQKLIAQTREQASVTIAVTDAEKEWIAKTVGAEAAIKSKASALGISTAQVREMERALKGASSAQAVNAKATAVGATQAANLSRAAAAVAQQIPDVVSQLSAGADPLQVFAQQGGQVVQQFDLMTLASKAFRLAASPAGLAVVAIGTAATEAALSIQGLRLEMQPFNDALKDIESSHAAATLAGIASVQRDLASAVADAHQMLLLETGEMDAMDVSAFKAIQNARDLAKAKLLEAGARWANLDVQRQELEAGLRGTDLSAKERKLALERLAVLREQLPVAKEQLDSIKAAVEARVDSIENAYLDAKAHREAADASREASKATREHSKSIEERNRALMNDARSALESLREWGQATVRAEKITTDYTDARLEGEAKVRREYEETRKALLATEQATQAQLAAVDTAYADRIASMQADRARDAQSIVDQATEHRLSALQRIQQAEADALASLAENDQATQAQILAVQAEFAARRKELRDEEAQKSLDQLRTYGTTTAQVAQQALSAWVEFERARVSEGRGALVALAVAQKAAAIADIGIKTAQGVMDVWSVFAAVPPVAAALSAVVAGVGAAQAATVAAQPVSFHTGGVVRAPDEVAVNALAGEGFLNRGAVRDAGGDQGIAAMNRREGGQQGGTFILRLDHRTMAAQTYLAQRRTDDPLRRGIREARSRPVGQRDY